MPGGKSQLKSFTSSSLLFYMGEKQIRFVKASDNEVKKLVANAVPQSTKKSTKYAVNVFEGEESYKYTFRLREFISHDSLPRFGPITVKKTLL